MSEEIISERGSVGVSAERALASESLARPGIMRRTGSTFWNLGIAVTLIQSLAGAIFFVGWAARWMRRQGHSVWLHQAALSGTSGERPPTGWPRWIRAEPISRTGLPPETCSSKEGRFHAWFGSILENFRLGVPLLINTLLITLPGTSILLFSWYDGWNNSFNKGYEQAVVGPGLGFLGIALLMASLVYLPFAQARQVLSGTWRSFYDVSLILKLVRREWVSTAVLSAAYAVGCIPLTVLKTIPGFLPQIHPAWSGLSSSEAVQILNRYFWLAGWVFVPVYLILRGMAVRRYARAVLRGFQSGALGEGELSEAEWHALNGLGLLVPRPPVDEKRWRRAMRWVGTRTGQCVTAGVVIGCWFAFVAQIYVGEFLVYHPVRGMLNQPLVQVPWFYYGPKAPSPGE